MRVGYVRIASSEHGAEVEFVCSGGCEVAWVETTDGDDPGEVVDDG